MSGPSVDRMIVNVLSIAGSDPGGGAGIQADLKTFGALGAYGMAVVTALTVQNTRGVRAIHLAPTDFVAAQIDALFDDIRIDAIKTGMMGSPEIVAAVAAALSRRPVVPLVVDPVLAATSGDPLGSAGVAEAMLAHLAPLAAVVTPNLGEAAQLAGREPARDPEGMAAAGAAILAKGARAVLVKGGHLPGDETTDLLCTPQGSQPFAGRRVKTRNTHGTGCTLSAAIAVFLAQGLPLDEAVRRAKHWLEAALAGSARLRVGEGPGPVDHFHALRGE
jgi:hydroxymethylpyrimidine/phosphomethylpyrimidine kinase